jgi:glycosyltransferase involved in cell wall biosynthesis
MDLVAEMLVSQIGLSWQGTLNGESLQPKYLYLAGRTPLLKRRGSAANLDRFYNRFVTYPRYVKTLRQNHDYFHVVDHSYAALLHSLPPDRSGVYCHDLDAFKCLLEPTADPRPWWFRKMAKHVLTGMQKAAIVFHNSMTVRESLLANKLVSPQKLVHAPLGVASEFTCHTASIPVDATSSTACPSIVHVGSCIPRKRIDVLLDAFAAVRRVCPEVQLIKVGGTFTREHLAQIETLDLARSIVHRLGLSRGELAEVYRAASVVLVPSDAEGFGLPVIEALACGAPVIASDIPVLREVGGNIVGFAPVGGIEQWAALTVQLLKDESAIASRERRLAHASQYTWSRHAEIIAEAYLNLA